MPGFLRPPTTLRLTRPYGTEDEFVARDAAWFGRGSITLPHAAARPVGELVRFEIVLTSGATVLRGEGPVLAHHSEGGVRPPGLEVRFVRIDARSKIVLDRVRARRASGTGHPSLAPSARPSLAPSASPSLAPSALPSLAPSAWPSLMPDAPLTEASVPSALPATSPVERPSERSGVHLSRTARSVAAPANRDEILGQMRERAQRLQRQGVMPYKKRNAS